MDLLERQEQIVAIACKSHSLDQRLIEHIAAPWRVTGQAAQLHFNGGMAAERGLEPRTIRLTGECNYQLCYSANIWLRLSSWRFRFRGLSRRILRCQPD
jgi:hypothetical protein